MKQFHYFNDTSMLTKFIKSLISTTNLPLIDYWKPGKPIKEGAIYLTENYIVRCLESDNCSLNADGSYVVDSIFNPEYFELVCPFINGEFYRSLTGTFNSKYQWYDADTHKYLGKYLRMLRDFENIDLMYLYNCVTPTEFPTARIETSIDTSIETMAIYKHPYVEVALNTDFTEDDGYKVLTCPIVFNQDYTIYINSSLPIKIAPIYFNGICNVTPNLVNGADYIIAQSAKFSKPIKYRCSQDIEKSATDSVYRSLLTLLIQVPKDCNNVVVLEGDYSSVKLNTFDGKNSFAEVISNIETNYNDFTNEEIDTMCPMMSNLVRAIDNKLHAFDTELIPYLLYHTISLADNISENIARVQEYISSYEFFKLYGICYTKPYKRGIWDNELRLFIYNLMTKGVKRGNAILIDKKVINTTGYIDRDVEEIIERGQNG